MIGMTYESVLAIPAKEAKIIQRYTDIEPTSEDECLGEDEIIAYNVQFKNGYEMDIKCCGVQYEEGSVNTAWCEAVLFNRQEAEVCCSEPSDGFFGKWELEDSDGNKYIADVKIEKERTKDKENNIKPKKKTDIER